MQSGLGVLAVFKSCLFDLELLHFKRYVKCWLLKKLMPSKNLWKYSTRWFLFSLPLRNLFPLCIKSPLLLSDNDRTACLINRSHPLLQLLIQDPVENLWYRLRKHSFGSLCWHLISDGTFSVPRIGECITAVCEQKSFFVVVCFSFLYFVSQFV